MSSEAEKPLKIHPFIAVLAVVVVFVCGIIGFYQKLGADFTILGVLYSILGMFFLENPDPVPDNVYILIAEYLASAVLILSIVSLIFHKLRKAYVVARVRLFYRNHIVIFSLTQIGRKIALELLKNGYKVVVIEKDEALFITEIQESGGIVLAEKNVTKEFENALVRRASACVLAGTDDLHNMKLVNSLISYLHDKAADRVTKIMIHVNQSDNINVLKDYLDINNKHEHYDLETFNVSELAAQKIYDQYTPHKYFVDAEKEEEQSIAIIGFNAAAQSFLLENIILSHSPVMANLTIYLLDRNADTAINQFAFKHPYYADYINLVPVKLLNDSFYANFTWSKKDIEKISKVKVAYMFGDSEAALLTASTNLRQFFYAQTLNLSQTPIIVCMPEDSDVMNLLDEDGVSVVLSKQLNIQQLRLISDTCTSEALIEESVLTDRLSRIINFYYSLKYEFSSELKQKFNFDNGNQAIIDVLEKELIALPENRDTVTENIVEDFVLKYLADKTFVSYDALKKQLSIQKRWNILSHRKKDSNRYAARQIAMKVIWLERIGCWPLNRANVQRFYPRLAPMEHKRWSAEKIVFNFKYGPLPADKHDRVILKDILKIHDQIIPFEKLTESEKEKDLNLFMLLPLLNSIKGS
ncbi:hypothetical protein DJ568_15035 [Mucilaginibacter hurinus]|uniref:RCK N-terminal domain-containing protein n=1 Tax=Mucilaginibacter hurinus TaxID=2201324 RepID=A0A367GMC9_9SPHI|nr:NAD-binding protein [Mucilaginibacter hurinus]RCH53853.1 hypothetical protein DJ568_15035 [Mucilaginibacter hurinus]